VRRLRGFTLIELLVVIVILAALAVIVFVALNPLKRTQDARDARRATDVASILTAIHISTVDSKGSLPTGLSTGMAETQIGTAGSGCAISSGGCNASVAACLDLTSALPKYLKSIPIDPSIGSADKTGYTVAIDSNNIVTVRACGTEGSTNILQSR